MKQKLLILLLTLMGATTTVPAVDYYPLWICGVQVTSENAADLSVINGVTIRDNNHKPYYDNSSYTLYLQDCTLESSTTSVIRGSTSTDNRFSLRILISGTVEINCSYASGSGIEGKCNTYIRGNRNSQTDNVLNVTSSGTGIFIDKNLSTDVYELGFSDNIEVTVDGAMGGIMGKYYTSNEQHATLYVGYNGNDSSFRTKINVKGGYGTSSSYAGSVANFTAINLHPDYRITAPEGAYILTNSIYVHDGTYAPYKDWVTIEFDNTVAEINETTFPDENFRNFILSQDYGADGRISESEVPNITTIDCQNLGIENLKGIEYFTSLKILYCQDNQLQALDVSKCIALRHLTCQKNQLQTLDVSRCTDLEDLHCQDNQLQTIDVHESTSLEGLYCYNNPMTPEGIDNMILNLPSRVDRIAICQLYVYDPDGTGVRCSKFHVKLARQKNWISFQKNGFGWDGLEIPYGDMNNDGELSVADVTILVNKIVNRQ